MPRSEGSTKENGIDENSINFDFGALLGIEQDLALQTHVDI